MLRKFISTILVVVILIQAGGYAVFAQDKSVKKIEQVKEKVTKLGTGEKAKVQVTLINGSKVKGYISQINSKNFVVTDEKSAATTEIQFSEVDKLAGRNLSTGKKVLIGFGIGVAIYLLIGLILLQYGD